MFLYDKKSGILIILILTIFSVACIFYVSRINREKAFEQNQSGDIKKDEPELWGEPTKTPKIDSKVKEDLPDKDAEKEIKKPENIIQERDVLLEVPFTSQAPLANWSDPRKQDGCEEASVIMAMAWIEGGELNPKGVDDKINLISEYEEKNYGNFHDTSSVDTLNRIIKGYYNYQNAKAVENITVNDIKKELFKGNLVIVPTNGKELGNPNYTPPGPETHNLVIIGYDISSKEFITNDPGTRKGKGYRYKEEVLENALFDYPTGSHEKTNEIKKSMIVVWK